MIFLVLALLSITIPHITLPMGLSATVNAAPNASVSSAFSLPNTARLLEAQCTQQRKARTAPVCPVVIQDYALPEAIKVALDKNYVNAVRGHFEHEADFVKKRKQLNLALMRIAQKPPHTKQDLLNVLLKEINPNHLENVECLIDTAAHNGHTRIIDFLRKHTAPAEFMLPILRTIQENDVETLEILLTGIDANYRPVHYSFNPFISHAVYYGRPECVKALVTRKLYVLETDERGKNPLTDAFNVYKKHVEAEAEDQECRLAVIQELFKGVPFGQVEKELEMQLKSVPKELHAKIKQAVNYTLYPPQLSMDEMREYQELKADAQKWNSKKDSRECRAACGAFLCCCALTMRRVQGL